MLQRISRAGRARTILGTLALAALVVLSGPVSAAHAAGPPDFGTVLEATSWRVAPGETAYFTAFYNRKTADNGPVKVTLYLQKGFGAPTITSAQGFRHGSFVLDSLNSQEKG